MVYALSFVFFLAVMLLYFKIADRYNIIDKPNQRSSHTEITIRGGGVIFLAAILLGGILYPAYWLPVAGALIIGLISFADDLMTLSGKTRIMVHIVAVTMMYTFLNVFTLNWYWWVALYILGVGIINMYNFMDGINGITGCYTLAILGGLLYINLNQIHFIETDLIVLPVLACLVFLIFNFRKKAKCFAGDVGSVTIAFWIIFLLFKLILQTQNWTYILFLTVYGVDSGLTIAKRLLLGHNIFSPHRMHLYQLLANEQKWPHLLVTLLYMFIQVLINCFLIFNKTGGFFATFAMVIIPLAMIYLLIKPKLFKPVGT